MATFRTIPARKHVALVAHDNRKDELLEWVLLNREALANIYPWPVIVQPPTSSLHHLICRANIPRDNPISQSIFPGKFELKSPTDVIIE